MNRSFKSGMKWTKFAGFGVQGLGFGVWGGVSD